MSRTLVRTYPGPAFPLSAPPVSESHSLTISPRSADLPFRTSWFAGQARRSPLATGLRRPLSWLHVRRHSPPRMRQLFLVERASGPKPTACSPEWRPGSQVDSIAQLATRRFHGKTMKTLLTARPRHGYSLFIRLYTTAPLAFLRTPRAALYKFFPTPPQELIAWRPRVRASSCAGVLAGPCGEL